jgi:hypothetical protein
MVYLDLRHMQGGGEKEIMSKRERKRGCVCKRRGSAILVAAILVTAIYYNEVID